MLWGDPSAYPKPAFPVPSLVLAQEEIHLLLFERCSHSARKILLFGFKNRTLELDFYGLVKNTVLMATHTWSLP